MTYAGTDPIWYLGDRVEFDWLGDVYVGEIAEIRRNRGGKTWLWIEVHAKGQLRRLAYLPTEVTRVA